MKRFSMWMVMLTVVVMASQAPAAGPASDWSSFAGDGDFVPDRQGLELTDDPVNIRVDWKNETHTGVIKSGDGGVKMVQRAGFDPAYGEQANPIVADGMVFVSWSQPAGDVKTPLEKVTHRYYNSPGEKGPIQESFWRIDANWRTIAIDAETGETLWTAREPSASMHFLPGKRGHLGISGAYGDGLYVTITILGHVFAYDADDGSLRWKTTLSKRNEWARKVKSRNLDSRDLPSTVSNNPFSNDRTGACVVGDVVVAPDLQGGLVGLDVADGERLWHVPGSLEKGAVPQPWTHDGKTWLLCNGPKGRDREASTIRLIDPSNGEVAWTHDSGANRGCLMFGDDHVMLNVRGDVEGRDWKKGRGLLACYKLSPEGLKEVWRFDSKPENIYVYHPDRGADRRAAIRDGVLYVVLGTDDRRLGSFDIRTGKELQREKKSMPSVNQPKLIEDKMVWQIDGAHSGNRAGVLLYQLENNGRFRRLGSTRYKYNGVQMANGYQYLYETPYYDGRLYIRGFKGIYALDLRKVSTPMARLRLEGLWVGSSRPVRARFFGDDSGVAASGKVQVPRASQLGVIFTTGRRGDGWGQITFPDEIIVGRPGKGTALFSWNTFSSEVELSFEGTGKDWGGSWSRAIPGLEEPKSFTGRIAEDSRAGYEDRYYPTPWYNDQPLTRMGELAEGQERMILSLPAVLPKCGERKGMTVCLDHDGETFVGGVGGAFSYDQGWHEIDTSRLRLTDDGIEGSMVVILHPDPWFGPHPETGGPLAGRIEIDAKLGAEDDQGRRKITGTWSARWGIPVKLSGKIEVVGLQNVR